MNPLPAHSSALLNKCTELHNFGPRFEATAWSLEKMGVADQFQGLTEKAPRALFAWPKCRERAASTSVRNPQLLGRSRIS